ncbi:MAG: hypothetical protein K2X35_09560 [Bryobacteraceae bacterium]|nr:hypothetical protein [Bryobacteraceae bacterium]
MADDNPPTKRSAGDHVHLAFKAALSAIPGVGGPAAELFGAIIAPPLTRRRDAWFAQLAEDLKALHARVASFSLGALSENENFVSGVLQATRIAMQTHQKEKLDALRSALLNIALGRAPDEDLQAVFLSYVEVLTPTHIRLLKFFEAPSAVGANPLARIDFTTVTLGQLLEETYPELRGREEFWGLIMEDLTRRGLVDPVDTTVRYSDDNRVEPILNSMGSQFLAFIRTPPELGDEPPAPR